MSDTFFRGSSNSLATVFTKSDMHVTRPLLDKNRVMFGLVKYILDCNYLGKLLSNGTVVLITNPLVSGQQLDFA
jgi:hypothetical protein